jgi:hypothetical protein
MTKEYVRPKTMYSLKNVSKFHINISSTASISVITFVIKLASSVLNTRNSIKALLATFFISKRNIIGF